MRFGEPSPQVRAQSAERARIVAPAPAQGQSAAARPVTARSRRSLASVAAGHAAALRAGAPVTGSLPSLAAQRTRVHEAAAQWEHRALRHGRIAWGYLHLLAIKPVLNMLEWVTETFPRFAVTGLLVFAALRLR